MGRDNRPLHVRFWSYVDKHGPYAKGNLGRCWYWTGALSFRNGEGRGRMRFAGTKRLASHVAWYLYTRQWPSQQVLHKCDNPACVRFSHLFQGNSKDNAQDRARKDRGGKAQRLSTRNVSGYKGVHWDSRKQKWIARISFRGVLHHLGAFKYALQAAFAYDAAATELLGMLAITNASLGIYNQLSKEDARQ